MTLFLLNRILVVFPFLGKIRCTDVSDFREAFAAATLTKGEALQDVMQFFEPYWLPDGPTERKKPLGPLFNPSLAEMEELGATIIRKRYFQHFPISTRH